jgi:riboflavin biosynthesis pyrimidine reductase
MRPFEVLFDDAEPGNITHAAYVPYGSLGFPPAHPDRPWVYANFVQSIDGVASFKGKHPTGGDLSQSKEDKWLMGLLRAHAGAIIMGLKTLIEETRSLPQLNDGRGPVYRVEDADMLDLRHKLGGGREKVIFVTASARIDPAQYRIFDGDTVETFILTTSSGAARLRGKGLNVMTAGNGEGVDFPQAMRMLRMELGIERLLCEGGPVLYGNMLRADVIDEKFVTIAPVEIGLLIPPEQEPAQSERAAPPRTRPTTFMAPGFVWGNAPRWRWMSCRRADDHQFNRYRRRQGNI